MKKQVTLTWDISDRYEFDEPLSLDDIINIQTHDDEFDNRNKRVPLFDTENHKMWFVHKDVPDTFENIRYAPDVLENVIMGSYSFYSMTSGKVTFPGPDVPKELTNYIIEHPYVLIPSYTGTYDDMSEFKQYIDSMYELCNHIEDVQVPHWAVFEILTDDGSIDIVQKVPRDVPLDKVRKINKYIIEGDCCGQNRCYICKRGSVTLTLVGISDQEPESDYDPIGDKFNWKDAVKPVR